ncbi:SET domain-containing protein [Colletotrichum scovillei]|uniref:SET domain-containing protein n=1 Tax=Colletotrichum scovillei TaxID=1209932 RepID=A0A9P7RK49_9PEZI|nr:SET domain-containing protein [Colletotrichum scovillei]KAG7077326.1 SET domain-containing protein [Colletotrichum scovillei]KAG7084440.1 SET domain-containing protein [Colletotrichum scovillei]
MTNYDEFVKEFFYFPGFLQADDQDEVAEDGGAYRNTTNCPRLPRQTRLCVPRRFLSRWKCAGRSSPIQGWTYRCSFEYHYQEILGWEGVRVEKLETCRAFPMRLADLYQMNTELVKYTGGIDKQNDTRPCQACGKEAQERKKCGGCGYYYYCDTACQKKAWEGKNHKKECKVLKNPNMRMLLNLKATTQALRFTD